MAEDAIREEATIAENVSQTVPGIIDFARNTGTTFKNFVDVYKKEIR